MVLPTVTALLLLLTTAVRAQYGSYNSYNNLERSFDQLRPDLSLLLPNSAQAGAFDPNWGARLAKEVERALMTARTSGIHMNHIKTDGLGGLIITTLNGVMSIRATVDGKPYTATLPADSSVSTTKNEYFYNGHKVQIFTITIDDVPYTYTTVDGKTTVTDGQGNVLKDGGPFHVPTD